MIELIFAIVIIAISVVSLPMMTQVTSKGIESNILQEAIFAASAELMGASSGYWDEKSMQDISVSSVSRVLDLDSLNQCDNVTKLRPGHINQPFHRRCLDENATTPQNSATAIVGIDVFDLNDAAALVTGTPAIFDNPNGEAEGYKDEYTSDLSISRTGNVKFLTLTVKNSTAPIKTITILRMQSANVGEIDYYSKRMF